MVDVDVAVSVYGKPFQTAVTLASLLQHSGRHIDRIYFQEELVQPSGANVSDVIACFPDRNIIHHRPEHYLGWTGTDRSQLASPSFRHSIRYQHAWENTDKDLLFISHNDCVYQADIIGGMQENLAAGSHGENACTGIGLIGQCWNCPAAMAGACNGDIRQHYAPTFAEIETMLAAYPNVRTRLEMIDPAHPAPLPECRLNEVACLINLAACRSDVMPLGDIVPFGFMNLDIGTEWFRGLVLRGHRFVNWKTGFSHSPFGQSKNGHAADFSAAEYESSEQAARRYLAEHFPDVEARLIHAQSVRNPIPPPHEPRQVTTWSWRTV